MKIEVFLVLHILSSSNKLREIIIAASRIPGGSCEGRMVKGTRGCVGRPDDDFNVCVNVTVSFESAASQRFSLGVRRASSYVH